jgi:propionyl-CoA carboxylase alpha chain/3-methylcrotonyl-CoA carboxylase alpha subunit
MGIRTVSVFSTADAGAPHVREADVSVCIGAPPAQESYLRADKLLEVAKFHNVAAIHPGYGFLSENAEFAEAVIAAGKVWVGAPPASIRSMGMKDAAKRLMVSVGVPVTPGYLGDNQDPALLLSEAAKIGWPILIKAVAGGGGKGMRKVESAAEFAAALASAKREATSAFGDGAVLLEKYVARPRHIEVQIFGDGFGNVVHLFERDCSIQRRHQKVIEEAPAPGMDSTTRQALCDSAVRAARAVNYEGAGTVEFIADTSDGLRADRIWFMEMNTRLQVEHPVTEAVTGLDLVEWQFQIASGLPLQCAQDEISLRGHAIEARLYAEDPASGFLPSTGKLAVFELPSEVRSDSAVEQGSEVTPFYDPLLAKLIAHGDSRDEAAHRLAAACASTRVWPVKTNAWFLERCLLDPRFLAGEADTGFVESAGTALVAPPEPTSSALAAAVAAFAVDRHTVPGGAMSSEESPWGKGLFGFQANRSSASSKRFYLDSMPVESVVEYENRTATVRIRLSGTKEVRLVRCVEDRYISGGTAFCVPMTGEAVKVVFERGAAFALSRSVPPSQLLDGVSDGAVRSPMPGRIVSVGARIGDRVKKAQLLVTLEAMKMEHALLAPIDGTVVEITATEGAQLTEGSVLFRIEPDPHE